MSITHISVRGARQHNLRDINVRIPRNSLTVVTGLSGSGKSSLAFDTIYAEGQRRYVETLSAYARQFLDQIERPDVDSIEGLSPAISIEQKTTSRSPRSTVGTITEIYDYLRLLYASVGTPHCPNCGRPISRQTSEQIVQRILQMGTGERVTIMAPIVRGRKGEFKDLLDQLDQQGFRARVDGELIDMAEPPALDKRKNHTIEAIVDRVLLKPTEHTGAASSQTTSAPSDTNVGAPSLPRSSAERVGKLEPSSTKPSLEKRLDAAVSKALQLANGLVVVSLAASSSAKKPEEQLFSSSMACPDCGLDVPKLEPRSFSFNSSFGACPECHGLGSLYDFDPAKVINDWSKPLLDGGLGPGSASQYLLKLIHLAAERYKIDLKTPFEDLPPKQQHILVYGPPKGEGPRTGFHGILAYLRDSVEEARSEGYREYMMNFMSATPCPVCRGKRLRPESLAVKVGGLSIADFTALPLNRALSAAINLTFTAREALVAERIRREIAERLEFLCTRRPRLPVARPQRRHPLRRRRPAHPSRHPDRLQACAAFSTFSTSPPSACTTATTNASSEPLETCATSAIPSSSSSTMKTPSAAPTMSSISAPAPAVLAAIRRRRRHARTNHGLPASLTGALHLRTPPPSPCIDPSAAALTGKWITVLGARETTSRISTSVSPSA
jgi:excinuclease ABC subunit A